MIVVSQTVANLLFEIQKISIGVIYMVLIAAIFIWVKIEGYDWYQCVMAKSLNSFVLAIKKRSIFMIILLIPIIVFAFWATICTRIWTMGYIVQLTDDIINSKTYPIEFTGLKVTNIVSGLNDWNLLTENICSTSLLNCSFQTSNNNGLLLSNSSITFTKANLSSPGMSNFAAVTDNGFINIAGANIPDAVYKIGNATVTYGAVKKASSNLYIDIMTDQRNVGFNLQNKYSFRPLGLDNYIAVSNILNWESFTSSYINIDIAAANNSAILIVTEVYVSQYIYPSIESGIKDFYRLTDYGGACVAGNLSEFGINDSLLSAAAYRVSWSEGYDNSYKIESCNVYLTLNRYTFAYTYVRYSAYVTDNILLNSDTSNLNTGVTTGVKRLMYFGNNIFGQANNVTSTVKSLAQNNSINLDSISLPLDTIFNLVTDNRYIGSKYIVKSTINNVLSLIIVTIILSMLAIVSLIFQKFTYINLWNTPLAFNIPSFLEKNDKNLSCNIAIIKNHPRIIVNNEELMTIAAENEKLPLFIYKKN